MDRDASTGADRADGVAPVEKFNPDGVATPRGTYSHVARVPTGTTLVVLAGQVAIDANGAIVGAGDIEAQCDQVYANVGAALRGAGAEWGNVVQSMTFLTRREDLAGFRAWREREYPKLFRDGRYPPNTLLVVSALASDELLLEVQVIAAV